MSTKVEKFEDLMVWHNAVDLSVEVCNTLKNCKDYSIKDQMVRSSISVPSNIAEGFERQYNKEFIHFLFIAKGSAGELRTQLLIAFKLGFLNEVRFNELPDQNRKVSSQLFNLIKTRKEKFS